MSDAHVHLLGDPSDLKRAIAGGVILAVGMAPLGVFLTIRRMTLMGDAIAHGLLPGVALATLVAGLSAGAMSLGGLAAGLVVAWTAGFVSRATGQGEETSLAALYMTALALGMVLLSFGPAKGEEVSHILFGHDRAIDADGLLRVVAAASVTIVALAAIWPALVLDAADPTFLRSVSRTGSAAHGVFLALVVLMLVASFEAVGTLLSVGLLVMPAAAARFWTERLMPLVALSALIGAVSAAIGLSVGVLFGLAGGPCVILAAGAIYLGSVLFGPIDGLAARFWPKRHYAG